MIDVSYKNYEFLSCVTVLSTEGYDFRLQDDVGVEGVLDQKSLIGFSFTVLQK